MIPVVVLDYEEGGAQGILERGQGSPSTAIRPGHQGLTVLIEGGPLYPASERAPAIIFRHDRDKAQATKPVPGIGPLNLKAVGADWNEADLKHGPTRAGFPRTGYVVHG